MGEMLLSMLGWLMIGLSIYGFARLMYYDKWGRALVSAILTGIALYMKLFF